MSPWRPSASQASRPGSALDKKAEQALESAGPSFAEAGDAFEKNLLSSALERHQGNLSQASAALGMAKTTLFDKVKKHGLQ